MKLFKPWVWRENAIMYDHPSKVVHEPYPFYWYRVTDLEIELVKQISKNCGVVQDWNHYVKPEPEPVEVTVLIIEDEDLSLSAEWKSWITLGQVIPDPLPMEIIYEYQNIKHKQYLIEDGKIKKVESYENNKLFYSCNFEYKKIKGNYVWHEYKNSFGVHVIKRIKKVGIDKNMNDINKLILIWVSPRPIDEYKTVNTKLNNLKSEIHKLYGKHK